MSVSQSDASRLFGHEASEDAPEQSPDMEGQITDSSSSESSSGSESEPEEQEESEEEPTPSQLQVQVAEGPVRSGSFISHSEPQEGVRVGTLQRGDIDIQPTYSGSDSLGSDAEEGEWQETTLRGASNQKHSGEAEEEEDIFSRVGHYAGSFHVTKAPRRPPEPTVLESANDGDDMTGVFEMMSYEDQPEILKKDSRFRRRAQKAISTAIADAISQKYDERDSGLCCCLKMGERSQAEQHPPATDLSPQLQKASSQGVNMMKKVFFPALPHLLQDLWVYLEFGITMFAFIFGLLSLDLNDGSKAFNIVYLTLTVIGIVLANIDCFLYFVQMGSCAECLKICYVKLKKRGEEGELELLEMENCDQEKKGCCRMSKEKKEKFGTYFELVRNVLSEAILYPLLMCDLFDFIVGGVFRNISTDDHLNFTLFVVGSFYLILAVYIMRMFTIIGVLFSFRRIPKMPNSSGSQTKNAKLLKWFSVHIFFQILTHALLIVSVALKIRQENPNFGEQDSIFASSFLWINVVLGGLIPIAGIISFFVANYYHIKEFSVSFWIDMVTMLQAPSFTEVVFPAEDGKSSAEMAQDFVRDSELKRIQKEYKRYKSPKWYKKFFFPLKLPIHMVVGSLFVLGLFTFLISLILTQSPLSPTGSSVEVIVFEDLPVTVAFFVCGVLLLVFNIKIIVLMLVFFALSVGYLLFIGICLTIMLPFIALVYIPVGCCIFCSKWCRDSARELSVFRSSGPNIDYFTAV